MGKECIVYLRNVLTWCHISTMTPIIKTESSIYAHQVTVEIGAHLLYVLTIAVVVFGCENVLNKRDSAILNRLFFLVKLN